MVSASRAADAAVHMRHIIVLKAAHHMQNGVHLADVREKAVAQPFAAACALNQPSNVYEFDHGRRVFCRVVKLFKKVHAFIWHGHDAHIGLNGAERIVFTAAPGTSMR